MVCVRDVVALDIGLPDLDGYEVAIRVRAGAASELEQRIDEVQVQDDGRGFELELAVLETARGWRAHVDDGHVRMLLDIGREHDWFEDPLIVVLAARACGFSVVAPGAGTPRAGGR